VAHGVVGTLSVLPVSRKATSANIASSVVGAAATACQGKPVLGPVQSATPTSVMAFAPCKTSGGTVIAYYLVLPRSAGGYYLLVTLSIGNNTLPAKSAVVHLQQAAYQAMGK
jgi:hypothetical protein